MKSVLLLSSVFLITCAQAQMVNGSAYLKGNYVEVGIDSLGGYEGVDTLVAPVPAGMHTRSNTNYFGFVANPQKDGWVNYDGDYYTPGSPENGWGIEIIDSSGTVDVQASNNRADGGFMAIPQIPGAITGYSDVAGIKSVTWQGHFGDAGYNLDFIIVYTLNDTNLYYTTDVTIINNGPGIIENLYYYRNVDPDNNVTLTGDYVTDNTIISQAGGGGSIASIKAEQTLPWLSTYAFMADDTTARVAYGGFANRSGADIWNGTGELIGTVSSFTGDVAIALGYKVENFIDTATAALRLTAEAADETPSASVTFSAKSVFGGEALAQVLQDTLVESIENLDLQQIGLYPNPLKGNDLYLPGSEKYAEYAVFDIMGSEIESGYILDNIIHFTQIQNYPSGQYFVTVSNSNTIAHGRFILIK